MEDRNSYAGIRFWGTIGWILAGLLMSFIWKLTPGEANLPLALQLSALFTVFIIIIALKLPKLELHKLVNEQINVAGLCVQPLPVMHREMPVFGFRIGDFSYITDANFIPDETIEKIKGTRVLVLNALRIRKHPSHFCLSEALEMIEKIKPEKAYLTHLGHYIGLHEEINKGLPENVELAYDGLQIELDYTSNQAT